MNRPVPRCAVVCLLAVAAACFTNRPAQAVDLEWVTVGNPGNEADQESSQYRYGFGAVAYSYRIGKYETTNGQYVDFLNAAAKADPYGLYNPYMYIQRTGTSGSYQYSTTSANLPVNYVSWFDVARFANWIQNGQGSGSTETGAYTLNGATTGVAPARTIGARFFIPTEDEWYKAAYYAPDRDYTYYHPYATQSGLDFGDGVLFYSPGNQVGSDANQANMTDGSGLTPVGSYSGSPSAYGTFDQTGNVAEWNDLKGDGAVLSGWGVPTGGKGFRGGFFDGGPWIGSANWRGLDSPSTEVFRIGFRLSSLSEWVVTASSGTQVFATPVSGIVTTGSGANPQFNGGFSGSLNVTGGTATLGGSVAGSVTVASGAAATIASGANLTNAKVSLEPGATLSVPQGTSVPIAAGNIGGLSIRSSAQLGATVLSGSVASDTTIIGTFSSIGNFSAAGSDGIVGKVLSFEGTGNATWALQMTYDPSSWLEDEASLLADGKLFLSWRNPATNAWVNAVDGNTGGTKQFFQRAWQPGDTLGSYGVDLSKNATWAVVNHNSDFAVTAITPVTVPEPSTYALALAGVTCIVWETRRRRRSRRRPRPM